MEFGVPDGDEGRVGSWTCTASGTRFYPLDPRPEEVNIEDIAAGLSKVCRYGGHTIRHYSVAQHCILVADMVEHIHGPEFALEALLHDSAEAYIGDMVRPLKHTPEMEPFRIAEAKIEFAVAMRFQLRMQEAHTIVKEIDDRIIIDEALQLMPTPPEGWFERHPNVQRLGVKIPRWSIKRVEETFLRRFYELGGR